MTIYIGNLSFQATEEDLREVFSEYGKVSRVSLPTDRETGRKRGFAFIEMEDESKEDEAIAELDGAKWLGREIRVNKAEPRNPGEPSVWWSGSGNTIVISGSPNSESQSEPQKTHAGSERWDKSNGAGAREEKLNTLQKSDFPQQIEPTGSELKIVLEGNLEDISQADLAILVNRLRKLSGDASLEIVHVEQGSIVLRLSGSEDGFRVIRHLWETGQISSLIGLPVEAIEFETESSETCENFETSTPNSRESKLDRESPSEGTINYIFDRCTVHQNNQTALSRSITQTENQGNYMSENYVNNLQGANVANMANALKDNARQQANQHIHMSEQRKTLSESASEIQQLLQHLEQTNPAATEAEKISYVNDETTPNFKRRVVGALQAGGEAAIEEFLDNPYVNVGKAVVKGWIKPE